MKKIYFLFVVIPVLMFSCSLIEDANTIDFSTSVTVEVPISVLEPIAANVKSVASYSFSETAVLSLSSEPDLVDYLNKIKSIEIEDLDITFYGLASEQEIESITLSVTGVGDIATISNVTSSNPVQSPVVDDSKLEQVAAKLKSNKSITLTLYGTTNSAPMSFSVEMVYDLYVEAEAL